MKTSSSRLEHSNWTICGVLSSVGLPMNGHVAHVDFVQQGQSRNLSRLGHKINVYLPFSQVMRSLAHSLWHWASSGSHCLLHSAISEVQSDMHFACCGCSLYSQPAAKDAKIIPIFILLVKKLLIQLRIFCSTAETSLLYTITRNYANGKTWPL